MNCTICGKRSPNKVCSPKCCLLVWEATTPKNKRNAANTAKLIGLRSIGEVRFAADLMAKRVKYEYEVDRFSYTPKVKTYCPDFRIKKRKRNGGYMYIEYKGNLRGSDRTTLRLIKQQYPEMDLRIVFEKPLNKLNRRSKTTYAMWAEQYNFPWADKKLPEEWARE